MSLFKEIPPTAGFPLYKDELFPDKKEMSREKDYLEDDFRSYLGLDYARVTYSGTAGFYLILEALKEVSRKKTVIIPAYICPLVPLAIKRAGLKVEVCDIAPYDFNFVESKLEQLCAQLDILAVVACHLGGIPVDFSAIEKIAKKFGIFIIEDCAQSLGAEYSGRKTGTLGDFAFFSLCRGKGLTIYEGGIIVARKVEQGRIIDDKIKELVKRNLISETIKILELYGYWLFYRPQAFWFVFRLPQIFWNLQGRKYKALIEEFSEDFPIHAVSRFRKLVGHMQFSRLGQEIARQREKANYYLSRLKGTGGICPVQEAKNTKATYPYLTLLFQDSQKRDLALSKLQRTGLGVSMIYAKAIQDYEYLKNIIPQKDYNGARFLAEREITLSTSTFLKKEDQDYILNGLESVL